MKLIIQINDKIVFDELNTIEGMPFEGEDNKVVHYQYLRNIEVENIKKILGLDKNFEFDSIVLCVGDKDDS